MKNQFPATIYLMKIIIYELFLSNVQLTVEEDMCFAC